MPWCGSRVSVPSVAPLLAAAAVLNTLFVFSPLISLGQAAADAAPAPNVNGDIFKMLQAGLPENVILNKIHDGMGRWDTSVDAIIALKKEGATAAELTALTSADRPSTPIPAQSAYASPIPLFGGYVTNHDGDVSFFVPGQSVWSQMVYHLVLVGDKPALILPMSVTSNGHKFWFGELLIERDKATFFSYGTLGGEGVGVIVEDPKRPPTAVYPMQSIELRSRYGKQYYYLSNGVKLYFLWNISGTDDNVASIVFLRQLLRDYNSTLSTIVKTAGITDPANQLALSAHFHEATEAEIPAKLAEANKGRQLWLQAEQQEEAMTKQNQQGSSGSGFLTFINIMQGVTNVAQAQDQANIAAANHDTAAIQNAANQQLTNIQTAQARAAAAQSTTQKTQVTATSPFKYTPPQSDPGGLVNPGPIANAPPPPPNPNANSAQSGVTVDVNCPASGFVPGATYHPGGAVDVSLGVPCTPGSVIYINGIAQYKMPDGSAPPGAQVVAFGGTTPVNAAEPMPAHPAECIDPGYTVRFDTLWTNPQKLEVIGYFYNNNINDVTCVWAFHKNGQWDVKNAGRGVILAGVQKQGGEQGGVWDTGDDSSTIKYKCYLGDNPVDVHGNDCLAGVVFSGMTIAGTDK